MNTERDEANQSETNPETQGGYMRSLHTVEEKLYSPDLKLSGAAFRILSFIKHNTIRWDRPDRAFSFSEISKKVGIEERQLKRMLKKLAKDGYILIHKAATNGTNHKNRIGLNPDYFGELIESSCRPKLSVFNGGKSEKLSTGVVDLPPHSDIPTTPVAQSYHPGQGLDPLPQRLSSLPKEPLKEPSKEPSKKEEDKKSRSICPSDWKSTKEEILKSFPEDLKRLNAAYAHLEKSGKIGSPMHYIFSCWDSLRKDYAFTDESKISAVKDLPRYSPEEEAKAAEAREMAMKTFRSLRKLSN